MADPLTRVPAIQWLVVPVTAGLLSGRPIAVAAGAVTLYVVLLCTLVLSQWLGGGGVAGSWFAGTAAGWNVWTVVERALYLAAGLVLLVPAAVARGRHHRHGVVHGWSALGGGRDLFVVLGAAALCFAQGNWSERAPPLPSLWNWAPPVGRLTSLTLFLALALVVRHLRHLDAHVTALWIGGVVAAAVAPGGWWAVALAVALTSVFVFSTLAAGG